MALGSQLSLVEALLAPGLGHNEVLERVEGLVAWERFAALLSVLEPEEAGRRPYDPLVMFKALVLQRLYDLSDAGLEEQLKDRLSFRRFLGLSLQAAAPDHTTLCRFRNRLVERGLAAPLFAELTGQLEARGLILKKGTMIDASLVAAAVPGPRPAKPSRDPDARVSARKGRDGTHFGYKVHVGVDQGSGLVHSLVTTPGNVNDTVVADRLVRGDEEAVYADKAYDSHARRAALKARGIKPRIMRRPNKHHPVLAPRLAHFNRLVARRRAAVETTFATFKCRLGLVRVRYVGLAKAAAQATLTAFAFNLRRATVIASAAA
jgi:IS5 family transposase